MQKMNKTIAAAATALLLLSTTVAYAQTTETPAQNSTERQTNRQGNRADRQGMRQGNRADRQGAIPQGTTTPPPAQYAARCG
jgi:hypothetical protein